MKAEVGDNWIFNFMGFSALGSDLRKAGWKIEFRYFHPARLESTFDVSEVILRQPSGTVFVDFYPNGSLCNAQLVDMSELDPTSIQYRHIPAVLKRLIELQDGELRKVRASRRKMPASPAHQMLKLVS